MRTHVALALRRRNDSTFIVQRTPTEVWTSIASWLRVEDRVAFAQVHFSLRMKLLGAFTLWSHIDIRCCRHSDACVCLDCLGNVRGACNLRAAEVAMQHSQHAPLKISVHSSLSQWNGLLKNTDFARLKRALRPHVHRLRSLVIHCGQYECFDLVHNFLPNLDLPIIDYLDATVGGQINPCAECRDADDAGWHARPRLQLPHIHHLSLPPTCSYGILRWQPRNIPLLQYLSCDFTLSSQLDTCLTTCPHLRHLNMNVQAFRFDTTGPSDLTAKFNASSLDSLHVSGLYPGDLLLDTLSDLNVAALTLDFGNTPPDGFFRPFGDAPTMMQIHSSPFPRLTASNQLRGSTRSMRGYFVTARSLARYVSKQCATFGNVASLELDDISLRVLSAEGTPLPVLRHLTVHVARPHALSATPDGRVPQGFNACSLQRIHLVGRGGSVTDRYIRELRGIIGCGAVEWTLEDLDYVEMEPDRPDLPLPLFRAIAPMFPLDYTVP